MPNFNVTIAHHLTQEEALKRVQKLLGEVRQQYAGTVSDLSERWHGSTGLFSFKAMGFEISGSLAVTPHEVQLNGNLPFAATLFKGQIEKTIRDRAERLLA